MSPLHLTASMKVVRSHQRGRHVSIEDTRGAVQEAALRIAQGTVDEVAVVGEDWPQIWLNGLVLPGRLGMLQHLTNRDMPMKRDWDVIREVLLEVEKLAEPDRPSFRYGVGDGPKGPQALLLWKSGFLEAIDIGGLDVAAILSPTLTWSGHDLLDTLRSKPVWERIKTTAKDKGIELSFDAVKMLGKAALAAIIGE